MTDFQCQSCHEKPFLYSVLAPKTNGTWAYLYLCHRCTWEGWPGKTRVYAG